MVNRTIMRNKVEKVGHLASSFVPTVGHTIIFVMPGDRPGFSFFSFFFFEGGGGVGTARNY